MSSTREQSRRSGNFKFRTREGDLVPANSNSPSPQSNSNDLVPVGEHPRTRIAREMESHERVGLMFRHWLSLVIGVSLGVALVIGFQVTNMRQATEITDTGSAIQVSVLDPNAVSGQQDATDTSSTGDQSGHSTVTQAEPSNILEHARTRTVNLAERKFLFTSGSGLRAYDSEYLSSDANGQFDFKLGETPKSLALRPMNDSSGRYELSGTNIQWQGAWQPDNPEHNIKLGSAYVDYVNKTFGNTVGSNLSAINKEPTSLLNRMPRQNSAPTALKSYSGR